MRGRQRLLWICTGLYTVLGGKNKGSATSRVCVFPLWYSTIFPFYTKLLSYTSTQFSKSLIAPSLSMTLFLNWQLCVLCSYRFVWTGEYFSFLWNPSPFFLFLGFVAPISRFNYRMCQVSTPYDTLETIYWWFGFRVWGYPLQKSSRRHCLRWCKYLVFISFFSWILLKF